MKLALASFCLLIGPALAQDLPKVGQPLEATYGFPQTVPGNAPMSLQLLTPGASDQARAALLAALRDANFGGPDVKGNIILRDGTTITAEGEVEVRTRDVTIRAERAVVDTKTGEVQASGNVRIIPVVPPSKMKDVYPRAYEELQRLQEQFQRLQEQRQQ